MTAPTVLKELPKAIGEGSVDFIMKGDEKIPVQKAIPISVQKAIPIESNFKKINSDETRTSVLEKKEPEVRRAEPVDPSDVPQDFSSLPLSKPKPVNFWGE